MNKYVAIKKIDGEVCDPVVMTATEIFTMMDMSDCYDISIMLYYPDKEGHLLPAVFYGTHCCAGDNLRMEIRTPYNKVLDFGYGTDH